jgi:hypothetical protein
MLSFALYNLLKHPEAMAKLRAEVDEVLGDQPLQVSDLGKFPYLTGTFKPAPVSSPEFALTTTCRSLTRNPPHDANYTNSQHNTERGYHISERQICC